MGKNLRIMVPCEKANHVCDKSQYKEASFWEKINLTLHLIYCKACRKYTKNNKKLSSTIQKAKVECLDKKCKESMKLEFEKALRDQLK